MPSCPVLGFAAYGGAGKTTLLLRLIPLLRQRGLRLGLIKHSHHPVTVDRPGKDSDLLHRAGAVQTAVVSPHRVAVMTRHRREPGLIDCLARLGEGLDLILVEGYKHEVFPKLEIHRPSLGHPLLCRGDAAIIAVAADAAPREPVPVPLLDLNDPTAIADYLIERWLASARSPRR